MPPASRGLPDPAFWRGRRVLVTGQTGFKGAWLALWLEQLGAEVTGFSRGIPTEPSLYALACVSDGLQEIEGEIGDPEAVAAALSRARPEVVIHMAAQPLVRRSFQAPAATWQTNVMGTVNLLEALRRRPADVSAVVVVTSDKVYENRGLERGYREDDPLGGADPYSSSKAGAELATSAYARSFFADGGPSVATARAGNVIGGGDWGEDRLVPDVMRAALAGEAVRIRNPSSVRPWQHVICPLSGYLVLAQSLARGTVTDGAWNFGPAHEDERTVGEVLELLSSLWPGGVAAQADPGPHPPEARYLRLDSSRARAELGWRPPSTLEEGLALTVRWYEGLAAGRDARELTISQIPSSSRADGTRAPGSVGSAG